MIRLGFAKTTKVMRQLIYLSSVLLILSSPAYSQGQAVGVHGWGNALCTEYSKEVNDEKKLASYQHWLTGYITGYNRFGPDHGGNERNIAEQYNLVVLTNWIAQFCMENPLWLVEEAAFALVMDLRQRNINQNRAKPPATHKSPFK
ncbi:hypothetical protein ACFL17_09850 [Pseudomonadota bacterium]